MMERLLTMRVQAQACTVEAFINDIPLGRTGSVLCLPVHEYVAEGGNEVRLVVEPAAPGLVHASPVPRLAEAPMGAALRLLLPRVGQAGSEDSARTLAEIAWAVPEGTVYEAPLTLVRAVALPIRFPRWRWLDMPVIGDALAQRPAVVAFLHRIAADLMRGEVQSWLAGSRLRIEELALAYQQPAAEMASRLAACLQLLHARKQLKLLLPAEHEVLLRPCAQGRLLECLDGQGAPVLRTAPTPEGASSAWPARVAVLDGHCHILR